MKQSSLILLFCFLALISLSQNFDLADLTVRVNYTTNDTLRLVQLDSLTIGFSEINPDSSIRYSEMELKLARKLNYPISEAAALNMNAYALLNLGNYPASLQTFLSGIEIAKNTKSEKNILPEKYRHTIGIISRDLSPRNYRLQILSFLYFNLGILYENAGNTSKAFDNYFKSLELGELTINKWIIAGTSMNIGRMYLSINKRDSALFFEKRATETFRELDMYDYIGSALLNLGRAYLADGKEAIGISYIHDAIKVSEQQQYLRGVVAANLILADISIKNKTFDSAFIFTQQALQIANKMNTPDLLLRTYNSISKYYQAVNNNDSVVKYLSLVIRIKDSLFNSKQARQFQNIDFDAMQRQQELDAAKKDYKDKIMKSVLLFGLAIFLIIAIILWRNYRNKKNAYKLLAIQKQETDEQKIKVEQTLEELKKTQAQLIQREKMASLGELTVGIAHEIENPLNFVNNFSEVNKELIEELKIKNQKLNIEDEEIKDLISDIEQNLEKINHHGKRADTIVKDMLQHTGTSGGQMEMTDINALVDECLRLGYQGFKRKEKSFHTKTESYYDNTIGKINIVPQDMGRVLLNLINNAFYAVNEKVKSEMSEMNNEHSFYEPLVTVSTIKHRDTIEIRVKDNGNGIPDSIKEKIFQPFFTTKPTGSGTGLGLSLSYDIIKAHGGEIKVQSKESVGTEFIIQLKMISI